jgi:hypothetical protein
MLNYEDLKMAQSNVSNCFKEPSMRQNEKDSLRGAFSNEEMEKEGGTPSSK